MQSSNCYFVVQQNSRSLMRSEPKRGDRLNLGDSNVVKIFNFPLSGTASFMIPNRSARFSWMTLMKLLSSPFTCIIH